MCATFFFTFIISFCILCKFIQLHNGAEILLISVDIVYTTKKFNNAYTLSSYWVCGPAQSVFAGQHTQRLSQIRINCEGCNRKGIRHKIKRMMSGLKKPRFFKKAQPSGVWVFRFYWATGFFHGQMGCTKYGQSWQDIINCRSDKFVLYVCCLIFLQNCVTFKIPLQNIYIYHVV